MPKIVQDDIYNFSISFSRYATITITTTSSEFSGNVIASPYALGLSTAMTANQPLAIKEFGNLSVTNWSEEQDWSLYNVSYTTIIPVSLISGAEVVQSYISTASLSIGDLVGIYGPGAWSTGSPLSVARQAPSGAGSQNAALVTGGVNTSAVGSTELFNGSIWSAGSNLSVSKYRTASAGSQNASLVVGGQDNSGATSITELFNGTTWSTDGVMSVSKQLMAGMGSQNAAMIAGGFGAIGDVASTELYNGSTWSISSALSETREGAAGAGSQNAGLATGGSNSSVTLNSTELFNGSTWYISGALTVSKTSLFGSGSQNAAIVSAGVTAIDGGVSTNATELFNGSAWAISGVLSQRKYELSGAGSQNAALVAGGVITDEETIYLQTTELHNQTVYKKLTYENIKHAKNIGIATDVTSTTCNVKIYGYANNINVTPSNVQYTIATNWVNNYLVLSRFSPNTSVSNNPSSVIAKSSLEADDLVIGTTISQTQVFVFGNSLFPLDEIKRW